MNRHETAHAIVFEALGEALAHAYGYVSTAERHRYAELICTEVERDEHDHSRTVGTVNGWPVRGAA